MEFLFFLGIGSIIGILAGLLGIGGGTIVVPVVVYALTISGTEPELIMKLALGTSFATIIFSTLSSAVAHYRRGSVIWAISISIGIGCAIGVIIGGQIVVRLPNQLLQGFFCLFLVYIIYTMVKPSTTSLSREVKNISKLIYTSIGMLVGFISSFVGIGGGAMIVPALNKMGYDMRKAIGISSGAGAFTALAGAIAFMWSGWGISSLPEYSIGYLYFPAIIGLSITSIIFAPLGAKLVYILPVKRLRQCFAVFLSIILLNLIYQMITR